MTLDQTTVLVRAATAAQELEALALAWTERQVAIAAVLSLPPSEELRESIAASIMAGEEATHTLRMIKHRARTEIRRLANIESGFLRAPEPADPHIDYKG
jgi:hypothetical protein